MSEPLKASGPELSKGIELADIPDGGMLTAQVNGGPVVAVRRGEEVFVLSAVCAHYGAPLWDGAFLGYEVRCPWHHAHYDVRTGEAVGGIIRSRLMVYATTVANGKVFVQLKRAQGSVAPDRESSPS